MTSSFSLELFLQSWFPVLKRLLPSFACGIATGIFFVCFFAYFPGDPNPSFFGSDTDNEEEIKDEKKDEKREDKQEERSMKEDVDSTRKQKGHVKSSMGMEFWLNAFAIAFVLYIVGIMISQQYGMSLSQLLSSMFPQEMAFLRQLASFRIRI